MDKPASFALPAITQREPDPPNGENLRTDIGSINEAEEVEERDGRDDVQIDFQAQFRFRDGVEMHKWLPISSRSQEIFLGDQTNGDSLVSCDASALRCRVVALLMDHIRLFVRPVVWEMVLLRMDLLLLDVMIQCHRGGHSPNDVRALQLEGMGTRS